jgi:uncharacterized protein YndB with AHSA1/START domain
VSSNASTGPRVLGTLRSEDGLGVVRMEDRYDTEIDDLWSALTDPRRLSRWWGDVNGDLRPGGEFQFSIPNALEGSGRVDECEPPQRLLVTMRDEEPGPGQPDETVIEAWLTADGGQTLLVVEERGLPLNLLPAYGAGVQIHVENLADYLAGRERGNDEERWSELLPAYEALAPAT